MEYNFPHKQSAYLDPVEQSVYEVVGMVERQDHPDSKEVLYQRFKTGGDTYFRIPLSEWKERFQILWVERIRPNELKPKDYLVWLGKVYAFVGTGKGKRFTQDNILLFKGKDGDFELPFNERDDVTLDVLRHKSEPIAQVESWTEDGQSYTAIKMPSYVHCYTDDWVVVKGDFPEVGKVQIEASNHKDVAISRLRKRDSR